MSEYTGFGVIARDPVMKKAGKSSYCELAVSVDSPSSETLWIQVAVYGTAGKRVHEQARKGYEIFLAGTLILKKNGFFYLKADKIRLINASQEVAVKSADLPERQKPEEPVNDDSDIKTSTMSFPGEELQEVF